ncbi:MAG: hypothetical protein P8Q91_10500 [Porticoccaceae bacterium]|nr:hypothetical protein [Porticoccaceae bacterium]
MRRPVFFLVSMLFSVICQADVRLDLLGRWVFESSNQNLPNKCRDSYLDFESISNIVGSDGSRTVEIEYSAESIEVGYNLITQRVKSDGKPDCHGAPDDKQDLGNLAFFFIVLSDDKRHMKFFFSKDMYYIYKRAD